MQVDSPPWKRGMTEEAIDGTDKDRSKEVQHIQEFDSFVLIDRNEEK